MPTVALPLPDLTLQSIPDTPLNSSLCPLLLSQSRCPKNALEEQSTSHLAQQEVS